MSHAIDTVSSTDSKSFVVNIVLTGQVFLKPEVAEQVLVSHVSIIKRYMVVHVIIIHGSPCYHLPHRTNHLWAKFLPKLTLSQNDQPNSGRAGMTQLTAQALT